ncbi:hypothetical protein C8J56DRAFT_93928 [Mycena floridula]|nr:hypothetical protein C8J56DRAFT_93928 [Mycena floridula]
MTIFEVEHRTIPQDSRISVNTFVGKSYKFSISTFLKSSDTHTMLAVFINSKSVGMWISCADGFLRLLLCLLFHPLLLLFMSVSMPMMMRLKMRCSLWPMPGTLMMVANLICLTVTLRVMMACHH